MISTCFRLNPVSSSAFAQSGGDPVGITFIHASAGEADLPGMVVQMGGALGKKQSRPGRPFTTGTSTAAETVSRSGDGCNAGNWRPPAGCPAGEDAPPAVSSEGGPKVVRGRQRSAMRW